MSAFIKKIVCFVLIIKASCNEFQYKSVAFVGIPDTRYNDFDPSPFMKLGMKYYLISNETVSWFKAAHICRQYESHLASLNSNIEMMELQAYLNKDFQGRWFWLSANNLSGKNFVWMGTGKLVNYDRWSKDAHADCVDFRYGRPNWILCNKNCKNFAYYICEKNPPTTISFTTW